MNWMTAKTRETSEAFKTENEPEPKLEVRGKLCTSLQQRQVIALMPCSHISQRHLPIHCQKQDSGLAASLDCYGRALRATSQEQYNLIRI